MSKQKVVVKQSGWADFGQFMGVMLAVAAGAFLFYNIIIAPYERHKELQMKLDFQQSQLSNQESILRYLMNK